jgi:hypothetical protein
VNHPCGIKPEQIAEHMGYHVGTAFVALWEGRLEEALHHLKRHDAQRAPLPGLPAHLFRAHTLDYRIIFNRPSPWCEPVRFAIAAICNMCAAEQFSERSRLTERAIMSIETAIADEKCMGRGMEP